jgi:alkanesulfonate monooxygenase SsuD/methylene tetrahydromethanopterin reductase-like flavin-dependent oxidoreductase (luciferase family)
MFPQMDCICDSGNIKCLSSRSGYIYVAGSVLVSESKLYGRGDVNLACITAAAVSQQPIRERVGFSIEAKDALDGLARVREAESAGVRQVWMTTGGAGLGDTLTFYAAAATQTSAVRFGTSIIAIDVRHPLLVVQQALAINDIAPGRLRLGVGLGVPTYPSPLAYLREYVTVLRSGLWEGKIDHQGKFFNIHFSLMRRAQIPLMVGALGKKAFRLAGEISDGAISWMCPFPYLLNKALPALRAGAESCNRSAPPLVAHVLVSLSSDRAAVRAATRQRVDRYTRLPHYIHMFDEAGMTVAADGSGAEALGEALVVAGSEDTVHQRLLDLLASGLDELLITLVPVVDEKSEREKLLHLIGSL